MINQVVDDFDKAGINTEGASTATVVKCAEEVLRQAFLHGDIQITDVPELLSQVTSRTSGNVPAAA